MLSTEKGLALLIDCNLSSRSYDTLRTTLKPFADIIPPYYTLKQAKETCHPHGIRVSDYEATVPLQNLLDKSTDRLVLSNQDDFIQYMESQNISIVEVLLYFKYGWDGSSNQSQYNQQISFNHSDKNILAVTATPL